MDSVFSTTIIIPQFNSPELTVQAIASLRRHDPTPWPVLIVDNGSRPASLRALHDLAAENVEILSLPQAGLTSAWNAAAALCTSRTLIFLNNDTQSIGPWVAALLHPLVTGNAVLAGVESRIEAELSSPTKVLAGWCLAVDREAFESVGRFDEAMGLYFSDTDLQLRLKAKYTEQIGVAVPGLSVSHAGHRTTVLLSERRFLWSHDRERFLARWVR